MKTIFLIRHCQAEGQQPEAPLTLQGTIQAAALNSFFTELTAGQIISSPFKRAIDSVQPLADRMNLSIKTDARLSERVLSTDHLPDWQKKLRMTFEDESLTFKGGESSREAAGRILEVIHELPEDENTIIVTHGNLLSLLLKHYNPDFGYDDWSRLSNPDVYALEGTGRNMQHRRLWHASALS